MLDESFFRPRPPPLRRTKRQASGVWAFKWRYFVIHILISLSVFFKAFLLILGSWGENGSLGSILFFTKHIFWSGLNLVLSAIYLEDRLSSCYQALVKHAVNMHVGYLGFIDMLIFLRNHRTLYRTETFEPTDHLVASDSLRIPGPTSRDPYWLFPLSRKLRK